MAIKDSIEIVRKNIAAACQRAGRNADEVLLLAVTKTRSADEINEVIANGVSDIGENRVQELIEKYPFVTQGVKWHIIGHLQTNKVKYIADKVYMIHSVDSLKLACEIDRHMAKLGRVMKILIEVNSGEENKNGVSYREAEGLVCEISKLKHVKIEGLMTMAPLSASEDKLREVFSKLKSLSEDIAKKKYENVSMRELSMGMSGDYAIAIEEGATIIRPGRTIFN